MGKTKQDAIVILDEAPSETGLSFELTNLFEANKKGIGAISKQIVQRVAEGEVDSVKAFINARKGSELFKKLEEALRPYMEKDAQVPSGEEGLTMHSCHLMRADIGVSYDYDHCDDAVWNDLNKQIVKLTEAKKEREFYLKGLKVSVDAVDEITGESWTIKPPIRSGYSGIKVSLK